LSYLVLARKSRPQVFAEVVGQQAVVRTLQNGLRQGRVPHALIFSGVRGTGKTTLARIMAKALNCEKGPTNEPCGKCQSCVEIQSGSSVDLHEVDGASNRGIQEIRELKENIRFMPTSSRYKIIIIDEVHMLTTEAFNALLKTLEEPPDHVYFMFATTELHKVPVTILSRCQRYELQRVNRKELFAHFASLAAKESITIDEAALNLVVREAGGSVRDGLSLLDQIFAYCGDTVTGEEVAEVLGLVSHQVIADLATALLGKDLAKALALLDEVYSYGMDFKRFINELLSWFRSLVVCRVSRQPQDLLDLPADEFAALQNTAANYSAEHLSLIFHLLMDGLEKASFSSRPRFAIEMVFIKAVQAGEVVPVTTLLSRLDDLLAGVELPQQEMPAVASPTVVATAPEEPVARSEKAIQKPVQKKSVEKKIQSVEKKATGSEVVEESPPLPPEPQELAKVEEPSVKEPLDKTQAVAKPKKDIRKDWQEFIGYVRERVTWMAATLSLASSAHLKNGVLTISFDDAIDCQIFKNRDKLVPLTEFAMDFFQVDLQVEFKVPNATGCETDPESGAALQKERQNLARDPLVLTACDVFNGQVGDIRVGPRFRKPLVEKPEKQDD
jgi:DNA polymerase-3 subunit gamma/tau